MGQKVHPIGFRLGITQKHRSYWCTTPQKSSLWIQDASFLRNFIKKEIPWVHLDIAGVAKNTETIFSKSGATAWGVVSLFEYFQEFS